TSSTNISGTKDVASQAVKKDMSSLRYVALLNWFHEAHMEPRNSDGCNADAPESSGIFNPTAISKVPSAEQVEPAVSLTVETKIPTEEPKKIFDALKDPSWVEAMREKLLQFKIQNIKYEDITQIDEDDIEEIDIKWNMDLLCMRADRFWKKTGKKITIQGSDVAGFDKSKVECFNCHKMGHFARECKAPRSQDRGRRESYKQGPKEEELAPKELMAIDGIRWDWSYMANEKENHALVADDEAPTEFALMSKSSSSSENEVYDDSYCSKSCRKNTENLNTKISKLNDELSDCETDLYHYKRGLSQVETRLVKFKEQEIKFCEKIRGLERDVEVRNNKIGPTPSIDTSKCNSSDLQSSNFSISEHGESSDSIMSKPMIKFVKAVDYPRVTKTNNTKNSRKLIVKYAEMYREIPRITLMTKDIETVVALNFKLKDDTNVLLRTPRQHNMYSINLNNIFPHKNLTCLVTKASVDESMLWHRRLGHLNFETMNKLVRNNLVRGLPSRCFENVHTCVACLKGKQHKASCKSRLVNSVSKPLHTLHMDLFGPTSVSSLNHKWYCLVVTDDFSRNRTLIEAVRTMLADAKLPVTFWAEAVNTACYVRNRVLFVGYSMSSKAFRVFNKRTKKVEENLHIDFLENKLIKKGAGLNWLFNIDTLTNSINYVPVIVAGTSSTNISGTKDVASQAVKKDMSSLRYIALLNWFYEAHMEPRNSDGCNADAPKSSGIFNPTAISKVPSAEQVEPAVSLTVETKIPIVSSPVPTVCLDISPKSSSDPRIISKGDFSQQETQSLGNALTLSNRFKDIFEEEAGLSNMETSIHVSPTPTVRIHKDHPKSQIIGPVDTPVQTKHKSKEMEEQSFIATIHQKTNPNLLQFYLFSCFLSQEEPKKIFDDLKDPSWVEAMQEKLLQFKIQNVWILVDCPKGVTPIGTKWVLKNKKDKRGIVIRNKAKLVAQGKNKNVVESEIHTNVTMADNRTMAQMLQAPIEGYEDAIVVPQINANNFELKQTLINLVQSNQFTGRQDRHNHLRFFNKVTSTFRHPEVPNTTVKLLLFPFSLEGEARIWLDMEPPRSILTWEDLDALDSAAGGNFLDKIPRECLSIIESKSKVRYSRSRVNDVRANANAPLPSSSHSNSFDLQQIAASLEDKLEIRMNRFEKSLNEMKNSFITPTAPLKAVAEVRVEAILLLTSIQTPCTILLRAFRIIATIDGNEVVVTESLIRTQLQLDDVNRLYEFTLHDVLDGMREIRTYNFSSFILDGMIGNIGSKRHKFLIYLRFLQMVLVPAGWDGADAAAANEVSPPPPPPGVPPTHTSSSTAGPSSAA
nr:ribonuclease H-like domain-containing protein [Tanacetum cinerariifolium]